MFGRRPDILEFSFIAYNSQMWRKKVPLAPKKYPLALWNLQIFGFHSNSLYPYICTRFIF